MPGMKFASLMRGALVLTGLTGATPCPPFLFVDKLEKRDHPFPTTYGRAEEQATTY